MAARDLGRLLRLSLAASAPADAAAGIVLGSGGWPSGWAPWLLPLASACIFHAGMALNDWADRSHDARTRPERPLPSGAVSANAALALALGLLAAGLALGFGAHRDAGWVLGAVGLLAFVYDLAGRGPWLGPLLLGLCRAGNLGAGVVLGMRLGTTEGTGAPGLSALGLGLPLAYGVYVFLVSRLGRLEDGEDALEQRLLSPKNLLVAMSVMLLAPAWAPAPSAPAWIARLAAGLLGLAAAAGLVRRAFGAPIDDAAQIPPIMGMALRRLLIFSAAVAISTGSQEGWLVAAVILAGYPLSHALRRAFPPS